MGCLHLEWWEVTCVKGDRHSKSLVISSHLPCEKPLLWLSCKYAHAYSLVKDQVHGSVMPIRNDLWGSIKCT